MLKKTLCIITLISMLAGTILTLPASAKGVYNMTDVERGQWYYGAVNYVISNRLMVGTTDNTFSPDNIVSRAMFLQTLYMMSEEENKWSSKLADVNEEDWYFDAVSWAEHHKIIDGAEGNVFNPHNDITREEIATMFRKFAEYREYITKDTMRFTDTSLYSDYTSISSWAATSVSWALHMKLINGYEDRTIRPGEHVTRAEVAVMVSRFEDVYINPGSVNWSMVRAINHMGHNLTTPENTLAAFDASKYYGFNYVESDVRLTADRVPVLLHDATINRTARYTDGTELEDYVYLSNLTFDEVRQYDFGIGYNEAYAGTQIPSFDEFIEQCKKLGIHPYVELKPDVGYTAEDIQNIVDIVKKHHWEYNTTWISYGSNLLREVNNLLPYARVGLVCNYISQNIIDTALSLQNGQNQVFVDSLKYDTDSVALCRNNGLPLEIWVVDDENEILQMDSYISGVTSNLLNAGVILNQKYS